MFLYLSVSHSVHGGGRGLPQCIMGYTPPGRHPPPCLIRLLWVFKNGMLESNFLAAGISPSLNAVARYRGDCRPDHVPVHCILSNISSMVKKTILILTSL